MSNKFIHNKRLNTNIFLKRTFVIKRHSYWIYNMWFKMSMYYNPYLVNYNTYLVMLYFFTIKNFFITDFSVTINFK